MSIIEESNRVFYINYDQLDRYGVMDIGGDDYLICGVVSPKILDDEWSVTNITELSDPDTQTTIVYDDTKKNATVAVLKSGLSDDAVFVLNLSIELVNGVTSETETIKIDTRVLVLNGYVTCVEDEKIDIWAIDFNPNGMQGESINEDAISVSINDIIMTPYGARVNRRDYGSPLPNKTFSTLSTFDGESILDETINQIEKWERRVVIDRDRSAIEIFPSRHAIIISIPYFVPSQRKRVLFRKLIEE